MNIFTLLIAFLLPAKRLSATLLLSLLCFTSFAQTNITKWSGEKNSKWEDAGNWTNGVPDSTKHVIIGAFDTSNQPLGQISNQGKNSIIRCLSLTIGEDFSATLILDNSTGIYIKEDLHIKSNGTLVNNTTPIIIRGNWRNDGNYTENVTIQNQNWLYIHKVDFGGTNQVISGSSVTNFLQLDVWGNLTLQQDVLVDLSGYNYGNLIVHNRGVIDPGNYKISWNNSKNGKAFRLMNGAIAKVKAVNYLDNYSIYPTPAYGAIAIEHTSTIEYAGAIDQNIDDQINYQKLVISGSGVKSLIGPTTISDGAANTEVNVKQATLDLGTHSLTRTTAGGSFIVANGATVKIGGATNTPVNFTTRTFAPTSTVEYYGDAQTVQHNTYGHLTFSNTGIKTMPNTAMTVQGNLTSTGTTQYAAAAALTVGGNVTIGAGTTFNGGAFTHTIAGNWVNNGTFTPGTGTIAFNGNTNTTITGGATFNSLTITKAAANKVTLNNDATATNLTMTSGELHTEANSVYVLGNKTGDGWIVGTITRQHNFTSGTSYAFNGPYAALTFTGASGINEITMRSGMAGFAPTGFTAPGKAINRLYEIIIPNGTYTNASLQLQYRDSELNGCEEDGLKLYFAPSAAGAWKTASRHGNNTSQNWVQRNTLTNVTGFWTLTDNPSTYKWDGTESIAWEDGRNWEVITDGESTRGVSGPISSDFVVLGENTPERQPTITLDEWVKDISFKAPNQITLTIANGTLRTNGNLSAVAGGAGVQHILSAGSRTVNVGGNLVLNDGTAGNSLTLNSSSATINVTGNIAHHNTGSLVLGSGNLNIGGNYNYTGGNFTGGTSTVTYNGTAAQVVGGVLYHHLTINKASGTANFTATTTQSISGNLTMSAGTMSLNVPTLNIASNIVFNGGTLAGNSSTIDLKGSWIRTSGTFTPGSSTVVFSGTTDQLVPAITFHNLSKTTSNTLTTTGSATLTGNLSVLNGTLHLNGNTLNRSASGGIFTLADGANLRITGSAYPQNFSTNTLGVTSTVIYENGNLAVEPVTYGYLTLQGSGGKTLKGNTRAANLMTIASGALNTTATAIITLDNNLVNNGNIIASNTSLHFTSANATYNGTGATNTINDLVIAPGAALNTNRNITLNGSLVNNGNGFTAANSIIDFTGTAAATITSAVPLTINELLINKTGATPLVELLGDINGLQNVNVNTGTLDARNHILTKKAAAGTSLTVANAATMKVGFTNSLPLFDSYSLNPTSTVVYNGSSQTIKSVQYGHLDLQNTATATFENGTAQIRGNMTKGTEATVITPATIEFNGTGAQQMPGINYKNLLISAAGDKTLTGNAVVDDALTFATNLTGTTLITGSNEIVLGAAADLVGESTDRRILGTIKTTRPVGVGINNFGGMGITIKPAVSAGLATMTRITGPTAVKEGKSIERAFHFVPATGKGQFNADITVTYFEAELSDAHRANEGTLELVGSVGPGFGWYALSEAEGLNTTTKTITASGVNSINLMTINSRVNPLPVELSKFTAVKSGNHAVLTWETASEQNNYGFEVEASADGKTYQKIGFVKSKVGTSSIKQHYSYTDARNGKSGMQYYRLRQVDEDGTAKLYGPRTVNFGTIAGTSVKAYPNPFTDKVTLDIAAMQTGKATLTLRNVAGKVLMSKEQMLEAGGSELEVALGAQLPQGLYLLTIELDGTAQTIKLIRK